MYFGFASVDTPLTTLLYLLVLVVLFPFSDGGLVVYKISRKKFLGRLACKSQASGLRFYLVWFGSFVVLWSHIGHMYIHMWNID